MTTIPRQGLAALAAIMLLAGGAHAQDADATIEVEQPWSRATPPNAPVAAGYMTLRNTGPEADRLTGATTAAAASVEIHTMTMNDGVMSMSEVEGGLDIAADGSVSLAPGGYHLMLIDPVEPLREGDRVPLTLTFERAGMVETELMVEGIGARGPSGDNGHASHDDMGHGDTGHDGMEEGTMSGDHSGH